MSKIRYVFIALGMFLFPLPAPAQVSIGIGLPHLSIGINLPVYPDLVLMPGYPVYYAPYLSVNYFFYDGMYWVYQDSNWYASTWYNGPWWLVSPDEVPLFILRIPVRYYRYPPPYFRGWLRDEPPRWGQIWGPRWEEHHHDWDRWNRRAIPPPAPLPVYQRRYTGEHYPRQWEHQRELRERDYRYSPRDPLARELFRERPPQPAPGEQRLRQQERQRPVPPAQLPQRQREEFRAPPPGAPPHPGPAAQPRQREEFRGPSQQPAPRPGPGVQEHRPPARAQPPRGEQMHRPQVREERQQRTGAPERRGELGRERDRDQDRRGP